MRYSLCSRFRGTLLGAAVGKMVWTTGVTEKSGKGENKNTLSSGERIAVLSIQSLIRLGRFDLEDWRNTLSAADSILQPFETFSEQNAMNCRHLQAIIGTLPISLFYHENEIKLRQNLQLAVVDGWQDDTIIQDGALAVGYALAQSLTEKLNPASLIPQTIDFLGSQTQLAQALAQVQTLLEHGAGIQLAVTHLGGDTQLSTPIALAFYCFLSTWEDLRLSVVRAAQKGYQSQLTSIITGALSGAYNSTPGIPVTLRMALSRFDAKHLLAWGIKTEAEVLELSDSLFAVWSGVYDRATNQNDLTSPTAIAAPGVIRSH